MSETLHGWFELDTVFGLEITPNKLETSTKFCK